MVSMQKALNHKNPEQTQATAQHLLNHPGLWRGGHLNTSLAGEALIPGLASGFSDLDAYLPGKGWPQAGLGEFLFNNSGIGELRLLAPLLRQLSHTQNRWIAWVNPPFIPYAPALQQMGIDTRKILLIHPRATTTSDHKSPQKDALWALERASKTGTCSLVLGWLDEKQLNAAATRRLQLAAKQGRTFTCLFRPEAAAQQPSMAELRLVLKPKSIDALQVNIVKRRGAWPVDNLTIDLNATLEKESQEKEEMSEKTQPKRYWRQIREQLTLWQQPHIQPPPAHPRSTSKETVNTPLPPDESPTPGESAIAVH